MFGFKPDPMPVYISPSNDGHPVLYNRRKCGLCDQFIPTSQPKCECYRCTECRKWFQPGQHKQCEGKHGWLKIPIPEPDRDSSDLEDEISVFAGFRSMLNRKDNKDKMDRFHVILKPVGTPEDIRFFYFLLGKIDSDFKYLPAEPAQQIQICKRCQGFVWDKALMGPGELKRCAKQCGIEVKVQKWKKSHKCRGEVYTTTMKKVLEGA